MNFQSELDLEGSTANRIVRFGENGCISHSTVKNRWNFLKEVRVYIHYLDNQ